MNLNKAIKYGKEKRKPYYGCKSFGPACRNHGSDTYMCKSRQHKRIKAEQSANAKLNDFEDNNAQ